MAELSGGMDSLGAVIMAIQKKKIDNLDLLHVQQRVNPVSQVLKTKEEWLQSKNRWLAQLAAAKEQFKWIKKYAGQETTVRFISPIIFIDHPNGMQRTDSMFIRPITNVVGFKKNDVNYRDKYYDYIVCGMTRSDVEYMGFCDNEYGIDQEPPSKTDSWRQLRWAYTFAVTELAQEAFESPAEYWKPAIDKTKYQIWNEVIPLELQHWTWSCLTPVRDGDTVYECGCCCKCIDIDRNQITSPATHNISLQGVIDFEKNFLEYQRLRDREFR